MAKMGYLHMCRKQILTKDGSTIDLRMDDCGEEVIASCDGQEIGKFKFDENEEGAYQLTWAFLDFLGRRFVHQGIGREILKFHRADRTRRRGAASMLGSASSRAACGKPLV